MPDFAGTYRDARHAQASSMIKTFSHTWRPSLRGLVGAAGRKVGCSQPARRRWLSMVTLEQIL